MFSEFEIAPPIRFFPNTLDKLDIGVCALRKDGQFFYSNRYMDELMQFSLLGSNAFDLVKLGKQDLCVAPITLSLKQEVSRFQTVFLPNGEPIQVFTKQRPVFDTSGEILYLYNTVRRVDELFQLFAQEDMEELNRTASPQMNPSVELIYKSPKTAEIVRLAKKAAQTDAPVLLTGETGVGKDVFSRYIYESSARRTGPFVKINCAAIPEQLLESELFGYGAGSFTGAARNGKDGRIQSADGGILFLDEINSLPLHLQGKLLDVVENKMLQRIGGEEKPTYVDFRLITATNEDLKALVKKGKFRSDLYYRCNVFSVEIPPLRERTEDIAPLLKYFLGHYSRKYLTPKKFSQELLLQLSQYPWPGNVRELRNFTERIVLICDDSYLTPSSLPPSMQEEYLSTRAKDDNSGFNITAVMHPEIFRSATLQENVEQFERTLILSALKQFHSVTKAAEALGVKQSTLSKKIARLGLDE